MRHFKMFVSFIALTTIQGHAGGIFLAFALEQNAICLFNLIKGHKERERESRENRDSVIVYRDRMHRQAFCRQSTFSLYSVVYLKNPRPAFKRSCMPYMPSQTHQHTNSPINTVHKLLLFHRVP